MRLRALTLALIAMWAVLAVGVLFADFQVGWPIKTVLCGIAAYVVLSDAVIRLMRPSAR